MRRLAPNDDLLIFPVDQQINLVPHFGLKLHYHRLGVQLQVVEIAKSDKADVILALSVVAGRSSRRLLNLVLGRIFLWLRSDVWAVGR